MPESKVHMVLYDSGLHAGTYLDAPELADEHARAVNGVVVELPILNDYRAGKPC